MPPEIRLSVNSPKPAARRADCVGRYATGIFALVKPATPHLRQNNLPLNCGSSLTRLWHLLDARWEQGD